MVTINQFKRMASKEKIISEIDPENDIRVRIMGTVIGIDENTINIDDGQDTAEVTFDDIGKKIEVGQLVRIIARVLQSADGFKLKGECIQDLTGFDAKTYKDARKIYESVKWYV